MSRVWLVFGASSGFGLALAKAVLTHGDSVVATVHSSRLPLQHEHLRVIQCDVTRPEDVANAFSAAIDAFGQCDIVFNGAGIGIIGEVESLDPGDVRARQVFEVNFWGAANVSREAVRVFREINPTGKGGRLINVSSGMGFRGNPAVAYYAASKHALEGFTESLAKELNPAWNIKVSLLEPGPFKTRAHIGNNTIVPPADAYKDTALPSQKIRQWFATGTEITGDVEKVAPLILKFVDLPTPPLRWPLGKGVIMAFRNKMKDVSTEVDQFESWSEDVEIKV